jgi:hypothetical protein
MYAAAYHATHNHSTIKSMAQWHEKRRGGEEGVRISVWHVQTKITVGTKKHTEQHPTSMTQEIPGNSWHGSLSLDIQHARTADAEKTT